METGGFYGGQAASSGAAFDPLQFVMRPMVILKAVCWVSRKKTKKFSSSIFQWNGQGLWKIDMCELWRAERRYEWEKKCLGKEKFCDKKMLSDNDTYKWKKSIFITFPFDLSQSVTSLMMMLMIMFYYLFLFSFAPSYQLFAIIVFGCISSQGWRLDENGRDYCIMNGNSTACSFGTLLGVVAFLASMGFLVGEYFFEQMSSVKTRKHYVMGDLGFSGKRLSQNNHK
jgi:hypothetical protein